MVFAHEYIMGNNPGTPKKKCVNEKLEEKPKLLLSNQLMSFVEFISGHVRQNMVL